MKMQDKNMYIVHSHKNIEHRRHTIKTAIRTLVLSLDISEYMAMAKRAANICAAHMYRDTENILDAQMNNNDVTVRQRVCERWKWERMGERMNIFFVNVYELRQPMHTMLTEIKKKMVSSPNMHITLRVVAATHHQDPDI